MCEYCENIHGLRAIGYPLNGYILENPIYYPKIREDRHGCIFRRGTEEPHQDTG